MRILHVVPYYDQAWAYGGIPRLATTMTRALARRGHGLTKRDLPSNINFFMNVPVTPEGGLRFADGISAAGRHVELVALMDTLVLISNCPQLNNPCNAYNPTPIRVITRESA